jgi:hypothetical protein
MDAKAVAVLEKFGWEKGKGLGRNESGQVESLRVIRKSNTKGVRMADQPKGGGGTDRRL